MKNKKLHKEYCEIEECGVTNKKLLHWHHIVERTEVGTCNNPWNLAVICSNCHNLIHAGEIRIIGVYPATNKQGRILVYERNGKKNVEGLDQPYFQHKPAAMKLHLKEEEDET